METETFENGELENQLAETREEIENIKRSTKVVEQANLITQRARLLMQGYDADEIDTAETLAKANNFSLLDAVKHPILKRAHEKRLHDEGVVATTLSPTFRPEGKRGAPPVGSDAWIIQTRQELMNRRK